MSRYIGKRVSYTCDNCNQLFSWNQKKSIDDTEASGKVYCSDKCFNMSKYNINVSKYLSFILRHNPIAGKIELDKQGWASIDSIIAGAEGSKHKVDKDSIVAAVEHNPKKRFELNQDQTQIRAVQGHSSDLGVEIEMQEFVPQGPVFHGTIEERAKSILKTGLNSGTRTDVHLSKDTETAINVGQRHGIPVLLQIDARKMRADGIKLRESKNGVVLVDFVPPEYISRYEP